MHTRRDFIRMAAGASLAPTLPGASRGPRAAWAEESGLPAKSFMKPFDYHGVVLLEGMFKTQYDAARNYYYGIPNDDILKGFRERAGLPAPGQDMGGWAQRDSSGVFGHWLTAMSRMFKATGDVQMKEKAVALMHGWAQTVQADGQYFTNHRPWIGPDRNHYRFDKMVCALVDMCKYAGQKDALPLLEKMVDWASGILLRSRRPATPEEPEVFSSGNEWYTLSENLYRAYELTGNSKYKAFGDVWRYPAYWSRFNRETDPDIHGLHAYSHVNTLSSAAMTYAVTGDAEYLKAIINAHDYFQRAQCYATGGYGPGESLMSNDGSLGRSLERTVNSFETPCGSWAIFKFCKYLLRFTGEARFGDWMEKALYNGIGASLPMAGRGRTFYYSDYMLGGCHKVYYRDRWPCCSGTYIQDVVDYHDIIYFKDQHNLYVNLFVPSRVAWDLKDDQVEVEQMTDFPETDVTTLTVRPKQAVKFGLKFRVPLWCEGGRASVNGRGLDAAFRPGTWGTIERTWNPGDQVEIQLPMKIRFAPVDRQHPQRVAAVYGPVVLVRNQETVVVPSLSDASKWISERGKGLEFRAENRSAATFVPFYAIGRRSAYCMHFDVES